MGVEETFFSKVLEFQPGGAAVGLDIADGIRAHELNCLFEFFLPDATQDEIQRVSSIQRDLDAALVAFEAALESQALRGPEYADAVNAAMARAIGECSKILGEARCAKLFGELETPLVQRELVGTAELYQPTPMELQATEYLSRYVPSSDGRACVQEAIRLIDPQRRDAIPRLWRLTAHMDLAGTISDAEVAYRTGDVGRSVQRADLVISSVGELSEISDAPIYFVAWAHHVLGRACEALDDRRGAVNHYRASLLVKSSLNWLPKLSVITTEVKLGNVESLESPVEAVYRLVRVGGYLKGHPQLGRTNRRLYRNLVEDSALALAEAYLRMERFDEAANEARSAIQLAKGLRDRVGVVRGTHILCRASKLTPEQALKDIRKQIGRNAESKHPRVVEIIEELEGAV